MPERENLSSKVSHYVGAAREKRREAFAPPQIENERQEGKFKNEQIS